MKKEKSELIGNYDNTVNKREKKSFERSKRSAGNECKENSGLKKRVITKKDGRYLIYYSF
ncbi:hypothetical protein A2V94_05880 [Candidatus Atribacteria bacterium RBG_16_35_8]|nr:MAG: hypothetical protein A2V94_05880 [Candidatus Atribacteria bacterium RBG_16_35_8]